MYILYKRYILCSKNMYHYRGEDDPNVVINWADFCHIFTCCLYSYTRCPLLFSQQVVCFFSCFNLWVFCGLCTNYKLWTHTCCTVQWAPVVCTVLCVYTMFTLTSNNDEADLSQLPFFPPEHLTSLVTLHLNLVVAIVWSADWDKLTIFNYRAPDQPGYSPPQPSGSNSMISWLRWVDYFQLLI